jgi:hypothetical protein
MNSSPHNMTRVIIHPFLFGIWLMIAFVSPGFAQSVQLNVAQISRDQVTTAPGSMVTTTGGEDSHVIASPNDADLGEQQILKRTENYQPFVASVGVPFYWTSNVALTNSGEQSDFIVSPVAALLYQPRITQNLYVYASVREQLFYYDRLPSFNFGSFDLAVGVTYTMPQFYNLALHAGYDYNRLTKKNSFDDFFQNHMLTLSAELPVKINRAQQLSIGADTYISMTATPQGPRRHDFDGYVAYSAQVTRALVLGASGRIILHDYVQGDRVDVTEMVALNASYSITNNFSASALASFAANQSNHSVFDYQVGNAGGAVSFSIRF